MTMHRGWPRAASPPICSTACCAAAARSTSSSNSATELATLEERDRALARALVGTVLRRLGTLRHVLWPLLERGLPPQAPRVETALLLGAAQILFLDVPDHAAVDLSVRLVQADRYAARYAGVVNAVLRRLARDGKAALASLDMPMLDTPDWLMARWTAAYGAKPHTPSPRRTG